MTKAKVTPAPVEQVEPSVAPEVLQPEVAPETSPVPVVSEDGKTITLPNGTVITHS